MTKVNSDKDTSERQDIVNQIRTMNFQCAEEIYNRLVNLIELTEEEYPDTQLVSVDSLKDFKKFLELSGWWIRPKIGATDDGTIAVEWYIDDSHHLSIEFIGNEKIKYIMFITTEKSGIIRGLSSIEHFFEINSVFKVREWITTN